MLILYSTVGCHLCEQAIAVIESAGISAHELQIIDIADEDALVERYGIRIPVIKNAASGQELGWPFDLEQFSQWFSSSY